MLDVLGLTTEELTAYFLSTGEKKFRGTQLFRRLHVDRIASFDEVTEFPLTLRKRLSEEAVITQAAVLAEQVSALDGTRKYLFGFPDGEAVEAVLMRYHYGNSVCISTQVGCRMGCRFCASTLGGLKRNLRASEMLAEVYAVEKATGEPVNHLVLMGSGEPFDNYDEVVRFLRLVNDPAGKNLGVRNITLSTSGLPDKIRAFAKEGLPITLALSLHAADEETRKRLMPVASLHPLSEVLAACDEYFEQTGRRVTYEYAVVKDVNDSEAEADRVAALLKGRNAHVNLIPVNPVRERDMKRPEIAKVREFQKRLEKSGINATIRRELGADIDGACGQLRAKTQHFGEEESQN